MNNVELRGIPHQPPSSERLTSHRLVWGGHPSHLPSQGRPQQAHRLLCTAPARQPPPWWTAGHRHSLVILKQGEWLRACQCSGWPERAGIMSTKNVLQAVVWFYTGPCPLTINKRHEQ